MLFISIANCFRMKRENKKEDPVLDGSTEKPILIQANHF